MFNFDGFSQFLQFWLNLSTPTYKSGLQFPRPNFLTPLGASQYWSETNFSHLDHCAKELLLLVKSQTFLLFPQIDKSVLKCWSLGGCQESRLLKTPETASLNFLFNIPTWSDFAIGLVLLLTSLVFLSGCLILIVAILKSTLQGIYHVVV